MDGESYSGMGDGTQMNGELLQTIQTNFVQVQSILDRNRLLINEINRNHESMIPNNLCRNVGLIRELNDNIKRVVDLYADLDSSVLKSLEAFSEGDSSGMKASIRAGKRIMPGWEAD